MKQALEALTCSDEHDDLGHRCSHCDDYVDQNGPVRAALRAAIAEASKQDVQQEMEQCPFGYFKAEPFGWTNCAETDEGARPLYEHPPRREWAGLTDEDKLSLAEAFYSTDIARVEAVEALVKEKNS